MTDNQINATFALGRMVADGVLKLQFIAQLPSGAIYVFDSLDDIPDQIEDCGVAVAITTDNLRPIYSLTNYEH